MEHVYATRIEEDEGRFVLIVETDEDTHRLEIHSVALELYEQAQRELRPWYLEAQHARATMPDSYDEEAYEITNPKHPRYVETMVDLAAVERLERYSR